MKRPRGGRARSPDRSPERGAAGLLPLMGGALVTGATAVAGALVAGTVVHGRAQAAADLVAIAGAGQILRTADPCAAVADVAARNDARLVSCRWSGATVVVAVAVPLPPVMRVVGRDEAEATAAAQLQVDPEALG